MFHKWTFLALKYHTIWLHRLNGMPNAFGNVNSISNFIRTKHDILNDRAIIIMCCHSDLSSQNHKRLILGRMLMNRHFCSRFHCIQATDGAAVCHEAHMIYKGWLPSI